jgi:hypothetical protein
MLKNLNDGAANVEAKFGKQKSKKIKMKKVIFFKFDDLSRMNISKMYL